MEHFTKDLPQVPRKRSNVIWIMADQLRGQACGYRGDPNVSTPNIDNLTRNGMRFDQAVSGAPWCCPFRGALLTSRYPHQNGVYSVPAALDPALPTITAPLKAAGYHTAWVGKWHLDGSNSPLHIVPPERRGGFDYWMGYENNNNQEETFVYGTDSEVPLRLAAYETDGLTDLLISHLRTHLATSADDNGDYQPFMAALSVQPPHRPYVPPTDTTGNRRYYHNPADIVLRQNVPNVPWVKEKAVLDAAGYYGMVENIDMNIGRIRMALKELGVDRETYILFFSDHGDCLGAHGQWAKSSPWEESIKIPFIVAKVGSEVHMNAGASDAVVNHVDIAPTTLGLCDVPIPGWMKGHNYASVCVEQNGPAAAEPDSAYLQQIPRKFFHHTVNKAWRGVLMRDGWKYVCMPGHDWLLFNTKDDPLEMANLCYDIAFQAEKERCHRRLAQWIADTGDDFALPDITLDHPLQESSL